jgi:hypothetical protein
VPLNLLFTQLTVAYVGGSCFTATELATPSAKVVTALGRIEAFVPLCPLYFPEYGQDTDFVFRQRVKIILNTTNERMRMKIRSIICNLYDCTKTVLFAAHVSLVDYLRMMVLDGRALLSSYKDSD